MKGRASLPADCCRKIDRENNIHADNHKRIRFDNDNNDNQHNNHDDEPCGGSIYNSGVGVGLCCSDFDVNDLTSVSLFQ